ncbi:MAG: adaptor protein MecA, partial [Streptococcaceae bacterium]|nr:adaptor protein MecA [Streptococcaceae bacterium]
MKYEEVNESTIKINLSFQDLQDHDVKLSDFFGNQSLIEQLFYDLVEELDLGERFTQTGMLTFQVQPHPKGVYLVVREENMDFNPEDFPDDPEEIENMMGTLFEKIGNMAKQNGMSNPNDSL